MPLVDLTPDAGQQPPQQTASSNAPSTQPQQQQAGALVDIPGVSTGGGQLIDLPQTPVVKPTPATTQIKQNALGEQKSSYPVIDATAKLSPNKPAAHNPLRDHAAAVSDHLEKNLGDLAKGGLVNWDKLAQAVYGGAQKILVGGENAARKSFGQSVEMTTQALGAVGRAGLQVGDDIWSNADQPNIPHGLLEAEYSGIIKTFGDYVAHPKNLVRVINSMTDPRQGQILTDAIEHHIAHATGLPDPNHFDKLGKIMTDTVVQGAYDLTSYASIGDAWKLIGMGSKLATDTKVGSAVVDAIGHTAGLPELSKAAKQATDLVSSTIDKTKDILKPLIRIRPDLDEYWNDKGKLVVMGIQNAADHVSLEMEKRHTALLDKYKDEMQDLHFWDKPPKELQHEILREMYTFGQEADAKAAQKVGQMWGWRPDDAAKAARAQGIFDFGGKVHSGLGKFMSWVPPKGANDLERGALAWWKKNAGAIDLSNVYKTAKNVEDTTGAEVRRLGVSNMYDLMANRFQLVRSMSRRALIAKQLSKAVTEDPSLMKIHPDALADEEGGEEAAETGKDMLHMWMQKNVADRQPSFQFGSQKLSKAIWGTDKYGDAKEINYGAVLRKVSDVWKSSLLGNILPHGLRNVGVVTALRGGVDTAAKGIYYAMRGIPDDLKATMKGSGAWTEFWRETPEMYKNLMMRTGIGAGLGAVSGGLKPEQNPGDPAERLKNMGAGALLGGAFGAAMPRMGKLMDRLENSYRAAYFEKLTKAMKSATGGAELSANDLFAAGAKVANDLGGYQHTTQLVKFFQGIGGTFIAYRGSTVPSAFLHGLVNRTGLVNNALRGEQNASGLIPANAGTHNPVDYQQHERVLGAIDEAPRILDTGHFAGSQASIGPAVHSVGRAMFDSEQQPFGVKEGVYDALNFVEGGSAAQTLSPWIDPYPNKSGMPLWAQELNRAFGGYVDAPSPVKEKLTNKKFIKAEYQ